ncbi:hypothetical protein ABKN59_011322 [Abortiporus biennis]
MDRDLLLSNIVRTALEEIFRGKPDCYSSVWWELVSEIESVVMAALDNLIHRNRWIEEKSGLSSIDVIYILVLNNEHSSTLEQLQISLHDTLEDSFYGYDITRGGSCSDILEMEHYSVQLREYMDVVFEDLLQGYDQWFKSELESEWRIRSRSRSPRLPPEIFSIVLDTLASISNDDSATLVNCCLTCQTFLRFTRHHLYQRVVLGKHKEIQCFFKSISRGHHYLRGLTTDIQLDSGDAKMYHDFFLHGQTLLSNLQSIGLSYMPLLNPSLISIPRPFRSVKTLRIDHCKFSSVLDLRRIITSFFPNLDHLEIRQDISFQFSSITLPQIVSVSRRKSPSLSTLEMSLMMGGHATHNGGDDGDGGFRHAIHKWLLWTESPTTVRFLRIQAVDLNKMLPSFGQYLHLLSVNWWNSPKGEEIDGGISFGVDILPNLTTLVMILWKKEDIKTCCHLLSRSGFWSSPTPQLSCIRLWLATFGEWEDTFRELDGVLLQIVSSLPRLGGCHLNPVCVEIESRYWEELPTLKSKGMLALPTASVYH